MTDPYDLNKSIFSQALKLHQAGELRQASDLYHQHLSAFPGDPKAWYFSGAVAFELGDTIGAINSFRRSCELDGDNAVYRFNLAVALLKMRQLDEAEKEITYALKIKPEYPRADNLLAVLCMKQGKYEQARDLLVKVLETTPDLIEARINFGKVCIKLDDFSEATESLNHAHSLNPNFAGLELTRGDLFLKQGQPAQALVHYLKEKLIDPENPELWNQLGLAYLGLRKRLEAKDCFEKALDLDPGNSQTLNNLGLCLQQIGMIAEAMGAYRLALTRDKAYPDPLNNLGSLYLDLGNITEATKAIRQAIALEPDFLEAWINLGNCHRESGEFSEAESCYLKALELEPEHPSCIWNRSLMKLLLGEFSEGFKGLETRTQVAGLRILSYHGPIPPWEGQNLQEKTLYIYADQGFGDTIQFSRFLPQVEEKVQKVLLQCHPSLEKLLSKVLSVEVRSTKEPVPMADFQCALSSLPYLLQTELSTIPAAVEFNPPSWDEPPVAVHQYFTEGEPSFRVGLCWAGNPFHVKNSIRSINPEIFTTLFEIPGTKFYSLDRKSTRLNSSHSQQSRMPSSA